MSDYSDVLTVVYVRVAVVVCVCVREAVVMYGAGAVSALIGCQTHRC